MNEPDAVFVTPHNVFQNRISRPTELPAFLEARLYDQETFNRLQDFSYNIDPLPPLGNPAVIIVQTALAQFRILLPSIVALLNNQALQ